jgi:hypothetical protein
MARFAWREAIMGSAPSAWPRRCHRARAAKLFSGAKDGGGTGGTGDRMSDDLEQMERLAAGLLSFKHMSPYARARFQIDLRKLVTARGGLSEDGSHFDKAIASDVLSEVVERGMRQFVIELTKRARGYMDDDKIEQLEADMSNSLRDLRHFIMDGL